MSDWPPIAEAELLERLAMDDEEFAKFGETLIARVPPRDYDETLLARALGYPWARPEGSYRLTTAGVEPLADLMEAERESVIHGYTHAESDRLPVLAIGSNGAPEALERKFAHFEDAEDRAVLALTGRLHDFDVGAAAQPAMYGAMPATLFPSPGTAVRATVLWVTPAQFTQLTWSELSYRLGKLRTRFDVDETATSFDELLVFVSRFGTFCLEGQLVALAAVPASGRTAIALSQEELLDAAAVLTIGPGAKAEQLVQAIFEDMARIGPRFATTVNRAALPFASERWTPFDPGR